MSFSEALEQIKTNGYTNQLAHCNLDGDPTSPSKIPAWLHYTTILNAIINTEQNVPMDRHQWAELKDIQAILEANCSSDKLAAPSVSQVHKKHRATFLKLIQNG